MSERTLHFTVQGSFVTKLAREHLYASNNMKKALDLLMSCLVTDELSKDERLVIALKILDGKLKLDGVYPESSYGVFEDNESDCPGILNHLDKLNEKLVQERKRYRVLSRKFIYLVDDMEDYRLQSLNDRYTDEKTGESLFPDMPKRSLFAGSSLLEDYMKQARIDQERDSDGDDNYGWLAPDGTFYPVPWGDHQTWAYEYVKNTRPQDFPDDEKPACNMGDSGDILIKHNWILLHSPHMGVARPTANDYGHITKAQKEFLFDYYMERNLPEEANAYFED